MGGFEGVSRPPRVASVMAAAVRRNGASASWLEASVEDMHESEIQISRRYKVPKIKDLYPVPGKHYTADRQSADTLTAAAVDGPGNVLDNGVASTTTAAAALALVF